MKAALYTQGKGFKIGDVATPKPLNGELLLRVTSAAICGTDTKIIANGHKKLKDGQRIVLGHEFVGEITATGDGGTGFLAGQRVGVIPNVGCGRCRACQKGQANYCSDYEALGITMDGAHAEYIRIPAVFLLQGNVVGIPETVTDAEAALLEPFSCVVNGIRSTGVELGGTAVIYGAGPIGLMHLALLKISGTAKIIVVDLLDTRLERASAFGANCTVNGQREDVRDVVMKETRGQGADLVVTAVAAPAAQEEALSLLGTYGRLCLFGSLPRGSGNISFDSNAVHYRNILVTGTTGGSPGDYRLGLNLVENKRIDLNRIISDFFPMSELKEAYGKAQSSPEGKVVMTADGTNKGGL